MNERQFEDVSIRSSNVDWEVLREVMNNFPSDIRIAISKIILNNLISNNEINKLFEMILSSTPIVVIREFIEKKIDQPIQKFIEEEEKTKQIIYSNPKFTTEYQNKAKRRKKIAAFVIFCSLGIISGLFIINSYFVKPEQYESAIQKGRYIILNETIDKENRAKLDALQKKALSYYPNNPKPYIQYAEAYLQKGEFLDAFHQLFGEVELKKEKTYAGIPIQASLDIWQIIKNVPNFRIKPKVLQDSYIEINGIPFSVVKKGALLENIFDKKVAPETIAALGNFHSNNIQSFQNHILKNDNLAISYYKEILDSKELKLKWNEYNKLQYESTALANIGNVYYNQKNYDKALKYFDTAIKNNPKNIKAQAGFTKTIIESYQNSYNEDIVLKHNSNLFNKWNIGKDLPIYTLSKMSAFYIDMKRESFQSNPRLVRYGQHP